MVEVAVLLQPITAHRVQVLVYAIDTKENTQQLRRSFVAHNDAERNSGILAASAEILATDSAD
jgi:hypothetical protein